MKILKYLVSFFKKKDKNTLGFSFNETDLPKQQVTHREIFINKMLNNEEVSFQELGLFISDEFDIEAIKSNIHRFRKTLINESVFSIVHINLIYAEDTKSPVTLKIKLKETVFDLDMEINVDIKDFHEIFQPVSLTSIN